MSLVRRVVRGVLPIILATATAACGDNASPPGGDDDGSGGNPSEDDGGDEPDAGAGDEDGGGESDAGVLDGGGEKDAAAPDGGDTDAGTPDGGETDASTPDGGDTDAGTPDGGETDAGTPDGGTPDAGEPDAGPDELDGEFLLSIASSVFNPDNPIRFIATVDFTPAREGGTADFSFQPIIAADCVADMGGLPVGAPIVVAGVPVAANGNFEVVLSGTLPAEANAIPALQCTELTADIQVTGTIVGPDLTCGAVDVSGIEATFGAIRIPPGTVGDENLPQPVTACP